MTHRRSSAVNASRLPSGDGRALRICCTASDVSFTATVKFTSGPSCCSISALNGIGGLATRRDIDAPEAAVAREYDRPTVGRERVRWAADRVLKRDSWSSRWSRGMIVDSSPVDEIAQAKHRRRIDARRVGEPLAVGTQARDACHCRTRLCAWSCGRCDDREPRPANRGTAGCSPSRRSFCVR